MTRVKTGSVRVKKHKKIIKSNKGFVGSLSKLFKAANQKKMRALHYSFNDRRKKKRDYKKLWIQRINGAARNKNLTYSKIINKLKKSTIIINKKILAKIALTDTFSFNYLINSI